MKTPKGRWAQKHIATLLGFQDGAWSKMLSGQLYPARLQMMQRIEIVLGWPVSEQVQLIPMYWEWPVQASSGIAAGEPTDLRYSIKLARVVAEWTEANPRTMAPKDITLHPSLKPINGHEGVRFRPRPVEPEEPKAPAEPFVAAKSPLSR